MTIWTGQRHNQEERAKADLAGRATPRPGGVIREGQAPQPRSQKVEDGEQALLLLPQDQMSSATTGESNMTQDQVDQGSQSRKSHLIIIFQRRPTPGLVGYNIFPHNKIINPYLIKSITQLNTLIIN